MIFDSHVHTEISADSEMEAAAALQRAAELGLGLVFTEHEDLDYPGELDFTFSPEDYWRKYEALRGSNLRLGAEIGLQTGLADRNRAFLAKVPFDLVIGSIHLLDAKDIYYPEYYEMRSQQQAYHEYFTVMAQTLREHDFVDILGHIDYIARYAPYENPELQYGVFREDIDEVLKAVVETNTVMELNTRRLKDRLALKELVPIYKRYQEMGGAYITLGSDAHEPAAIGMAFAAARDFAEACRLSIVTFQGRTMEKCSS
mgnify:CR=1 FL=1